MKSVIIDDERLARQELKLLLAAFPQVSIVGEAETVPSAFKVIQETMPDLIFLDVQLRGGVAFDLLQRLEQLPDPKPLIVFCTAYEEHATKAFETRALDYLLKPVAPERLAKTIAKIEAALDSEAGPPSPPNTTGLAADGFVLLRQEGKHDLVLVRDLMFIESEGNYCRVHLNKKERTSYLLYSTLNSLQQRLPPELFIRANRAHIVNLSHIESIEPWFSQSLKIRLTSGLEIEFSRRAAQSFRERFTL